ncbi:class I SAM-dependent methyltransferase [Rhodovulum strictum]|uniref:Methyltransferase domain-containing protein n=1 Tax=Rhodovulum strictum TaxID=58314 RepID=A0A844BKW1_9RHOB|nr:class I SAM-dependent methyltransferase [Rhodovulum strictum]MRH20627.1 methyltransferase domain-containing protein [Rhodovulum strictum]
MAGLYDVRFLASIKAGSSRSAAIVLDHLAPLIETLPRSVVDIGCGSGSWAAAFAARFPGAELRGIDGDYVDRTRLSIRPADFRAHDLTRPLPADRRFGLAISLEVAEHLPPESGPEFIRTLVGHADHVLFSAAIPGQGGEHHVNERPPDYWRGLFRSHGYVAVDCLRPALHRDRRIEPWYRYNAILYVRADRLADLPAAYSAAIVPADAPLADLASGWWRLRCAIIRRLPAGAVLMLARTRRRLLSRRPAPAARLRAAA